MKQEPYNMVKVPLPEVTKIILTDGVGDKVTVQAIDICLETDGERIMIDVDPETKDEEGNYHVGLRLPCGKEITVLVPGEGAYEYEILTSSTHLVEIVGLNLVTKGHYL